ncbi:MAG: AMP-binding protein [Dehalococcoidia bacterium]
MTWAVLQAYGMTEAAHQVATNPLPPGERKEGSVGLPTGLQVAALDDAGNELPRAPMGEIALKGENAARGYLRNPEATAAAFTNGWFRTGDQGAIDEQGYIFLHGRIKELINRGGEKITPGEIDDVRCCAISAGRGGGGRRAARDLRRRGRGSGGAEGRSLGKRRRTDRLHRRTLGPLQDAEGDPLRAPDPAWRHRQDSAPPSTGAAGRTTVPDVGELLDGRAHPAAGDVATPVPPREPSAGGRQWLVR